MLHLPTIISLSFIFNLLIGILFISFYLHKKTTSFLLFGGACISFATAILLVSFKEQLNHPWLTHYLANLFIILSPLLLVIGLNKFNNKAVINLTPLAYLYGLCALLLVFVYNHVLSQILTSFMVAVLFLYGAFILLKTHCAAKLQQRLLIIGLVTHSLVMLGQAILLLLPFITSNNDDFKPQLHILLIAHLFITTLCALVLPFIIFANSESKLINLANNDSLTQLLNRRGFFSTCKNIKANTADKNHTLALIMLDIDFFKRVNDKYGHDVGDQALKWIAQHISQLFMNIGITARIGGEEFAVLLNGYTLEQANTLAEQLSVNIRQQPFYCNDQPIPLSVSAGVSSTTINQLNLKELLLHADKHLYLAKETGRDKVVSQYDHTLFSQANTSAI
ncbi:hypothetical protein PTRA_a1617 [Pseudoalteromonas translucida KMM 520]|uniref:diguanylate cyclase n=2 Tax=Pseudoalteromonas TaxID=53246 RepID=A0A0U2WYM0_9GAMM|nr:GGDEF domain-containing protein [Pseudoalteromonas translucida]ALS32801.1 hypothetical protein PTRA_a1617 [Pseudoalteromonas translucida KMM 520]